MKPRQKKPKTWGREIATFVLLWFIFYVVPMKGIEYAEILVLPVFSLWTLAYGLKRLTNDTSMFGDTTQSTYGGRPQRSSEYSDWEEQPTDHWHVDRHGGPKDSQATGERY